MFIIDGKFTKVMSMCFDCMVLSVLMILASIPIVTAGAAAAAAYYVVNKVFFRAEGNLGREFWRSFRASFGQATLVWVCVLLLMTAIIGNLYFAMQNGGIQSAGFWLFCVLAAVIAVLAQYLIACIARFDNRMLVILKNVLLISVANPLISIGLLGLLLVSVAIMIFAFPLSPILVPAFHTIAANRMIERVFQKYQQEENDKQ